MRTDVSRTSGAGKLFDSVIAAFCVAPLLLFITTLLVGYNEKRDACEERAQDEGVQKTKLISGTNPTEDEGKLVLFHADLQKPTANNVDFAPGGAHFVIPPGFTTVGLSVSSEMLQCVETSHEEKRKDAVGGGETTYTTYSYQARWESSWIDSSMFKDKGDNWHANCGVENPRWSDWGVPDSRTKYASSAQVGAFTIPAGYVSEIPLTSLITDPEFMTDKATAEGFGSCEGLWPGYSFCYDGRQAPHSIGATRVTFKTFDWSRPTLSVLGENHNGVISQWTASDSWMCSGFTLGKLYPGTYTVESFFASLKGESKTITMILRILGFLMAWCAFSMMFGPLKVAADCVPCVGPCLGDMVEAVACCVSCPPGCACVTCVASIVWIFMRPLWGIMLALFSLSIVGGYVYFKMNPPKGAQGLERKVALQQPLKFSIV